MVSQKKGLIVVAHPDDESLFFSGLMQNGPKEQESFHVICITDGNADALGPERAGEFARACQHHKVDQFEQWDFPDVYEKRLDVDQLIKRLQSMEGYDTVYSHGILGEYGHPHHQDVGYAVHKAFEGRAPVWSVAYNIFPQKLINFDEKMYEHKMMALTEIYFLETKRFLHLIQGTFSEGFTQVKMEEVEHLYSVLSGDCEPDPSKIKVNALMIPYIVEVFQKSHMKRLF